MMKIIDTIKAIREQLGVVRRADKKIALVPTMGNLHQGHLALVEQVQKVSDHVVVSIFVNPTQFVEGEDFDKYPRTLEEDLGLLESLNVDSVFVPNTNEIYGDAELTVEVSVPELDSIYCGEFRPGHFQGVATIVTKLFNIVQPDIAIFGAKDYQQLLVIRSVVNNLNLPIEVIGAPTVREVDGLAMSSRNTYLTDQERLQAPILKKCITETAIAIKNGDVNYKDLENRAKKTLVDAGFRLDYFSICDAKTLKLPINQELVILAAAWLGKARLIDNVAVQSYD